MPFRTQGNLWRNFHFNKQTQGSLIIKPPLKADPGLWVSFHAEREKKERGKHVIRKQLGSKDAQLSGLTVTSVTSLPQRPYLASHLTAFRSRFYWLHTVNVYHHLWPHHSSPWWQDKPTGYSWAGGFWEVAGIGAQTGSKKENFLKF